MIRKIESVYVKKTEMTDWPRQVPLEDYQTAAQEFIRFFSRIPGIHAILKFGSVAAPGLSDLDFFVVLAENYRHRFATQYGLQPFSSNTRYILYHPQITVQLSVAQHIHRLFPVGPVETVWGEPVRFIPQKEEHLKEVSLGHLFDMIIQSFLREYWHLIRSRTLRMRYAVTWLNHFNGYIKMLHDVGCPIDAMWTLLAEDIHEFRLNYFKKSTNDNLMQLKDFLCRALFSAYEMAFALDQLVGARYFYADRKAAGCQFNFSGMKTTFSHLEGPENSIQKTLNMVERNGQVSIFLPVNWFGILLFYASNSGYVSRHIRTHLQQPREDVDFWVDKGVFEEKIRLLNQHAAFFLDRKIPGIFFQNYGFRGNIRVGLLERLFSCAGNGARKLSRIIKP